MSMEACYSPPPTTGLSRPGKAFLVYSEALMNIRLAMYQALKAIDVPEPKIDAVIQAMETALQSPPVAKSDPDVEHFRTELSRVASDVTLNIGTMMFPVVAVVFVLMVMIH